MQKHVNLVDLVKSFPTNIYLQNLASIQKRTSPVKFAHLAEKSGKGSISNLSTRWMTMVKSGGGLPRKRFDTDLPVRPNSPDRNSSQQIRTTRALLTEPDTGHTLFGRADAFQNSTLDS